MVVLVISSVALRGFLGRVAIFLSLLFGYALSWVLDLVTGPITSYDATAGAVTEHFRVNWDGVASASWFGLPPFTDEPTASSASMPRPSASPSSCSYCPVSSR